MPVAKNRSFWSHRGRQTAGKNTIGRERSYGSAADGVETQTMKSRVRSKMAVGLLKQYAKSILILVVDPI